MNAAPRSSASQEPRRKCRSGGFPQGSAGSTGFSLACAAIEAAVNCTHSSSGSSRVAREISSRRPTVTIGKPWRSRWRRRAGTIRPGRSRPRSGADSAPRRAAAQRSRESAGLPASMASTSNEHQPKTCSARERPGSPHSESIAGPSEPPSTTHSESARRTMPGTPAAPMRPIRMRPVGDTIVRSA